MILETPLQTVAPALAVFVLWILCVFRVGRDLRVPRYAWILVLLAMFIRLFVVPALDGHMFDGHEAEYWDLFRGVREPTRGGTVMVPAMQWFWWLSGRVLPAWPQLPVIMMSMLGVASIGLAAGAIGMLTERRVGWFLAILLASNPEHAAWSSSAYNIIIPHFFGCTALFAAATALRRPHLSSAWLWLTAASLALGAATRMDSATVGVLILLLVLFGPANNDSFIERLRRWTPVGFVALLLALACAWPMLWPGALPGAGDRWLSFANNVGFYALYSPFDDWTVALVLGVLTVDAIMRKPRVALPLLGLVVLHHLLMATFDDFGARHTLVVLPALLALAAFSVSRRDLRFCIPLVVLGAQIPDLVAMHEHFYASEDDFSAHLGERWPDLERREYAGTPPEGCGWIAEDARVAATPLASHFNVLSPEEEASLRGPDGCLQWCLDVQDWRWSSRGVRDRARRLTHLFEMSASHVVVDSATGYECLVMDVGPRTRSTLWLDDGNNPTASTSDPALP